MVSLSCKERLELTIFGYVRLNHKDEIPDDITRICLDYCNKIANLVTDDGLEINIQHLHLQLDGIKEFIVLH